MADISQVRLLRRGSAPWNSWRQSNPTIVPDLSSAELTYTDLSGADLSRANLIEADLSYSDLSRANFNYAELRNANLVQVDLNHADLSGANLSQSQLHSANLHHALLTSAQLENANMAQAELFSADLSRANLRKAFLKRANLANARLDEADLSEANLVGANLSEAHLHATLLHRTNLNEACVRGIITRHLTLKTTSQLDLAITLDQRPTITVDHLHLAQFISSWLLNPDLREDMTVRSKKLILVLGYFEDGRKDLLMALKNSLRQRDSIPLVVDLDHIPVRELEEIIRPLSQITYLVITDLSNLNGNSQDLQSLLTQLHRPVLPLVQEDQISNTWFLETRNYPYVRNSIIYKDGNTLDLLLPHPLSK